MDDCASLPLCFRIWVVFKLCSVHVFKKHVKVQSKCDECSVKFRVQHVVREKLHNLSFGKATFEVCKGVMRERDFLVFWTCSEDFFIVFFFFSSQWWYLSRTLLLFGRFFVFFL